MDERDFSFEIDGRTFLLDENKNISTDSKVENQSAAQEELRKEHKREPIAPKTRQQELEEFAQLIDDVLGDKPEAGDATFFSDAAKIITKKRV